MMDPGIEISAAPAVIPTKPPNTPFNEMEGSIFPKRIFVYSAEATKAADVDSNVVAITFGTKLVSAARVLAPLKPNQPNQRTNTPSAPKGMLCPGMTFTFLPEYFPIRGQRKITTAKAELAPVKWTTVEPAKSVNPSCASHPSPDQTQWPMTGYTIVLITTVIMI